ncbi:MAG: ATP-binding protein [Anaerolineae bacterium]
MIFTTNKPLADWGQVLHDPDLAEAIVDRVLERGRLILMDGPSLRTRHIDPSQLPEPARISGKSRPEFPEPTSSPSPAAASAWLGATPSVRPPAHPRPNPRRSSPQPNWRSLPPYPQLPDPFDHSRHHPPIPAIPSSPCPMKIWPTLRVKLWGNG